MKKDTLRMSLDRGFKSSKRKTSRQKIASSALVYALCAVLLFAGIPLLFSSLTAADGCSHVHDNSCGFIAATPCSHSHNASCGFTESSPCTYVHIHDALCGYDIDNDSPCLSLLHIHNDSCGYAIAIACAHVCDDGCGFHAGAPCEFVCDDECCAADNCDDSNLEDNNDSKISDSVVIIDDTENDNTNTTSTSSNSLEDLELGGTMPAMFEGIMEMSGSLFQPFSFAATVTTAIASQNGQSIVITLNLSGETLDGTDGDPYTASNWSVSINGGAGPTVTAAVRTNGTTITLTLDPSTLTPIRFDSINVTFSYSGSDVAIDDNGTPEPIDDLTDEDVDTDNVTAGAPPTLSVTTPTRTITAAVTGTSAVAEYAITSTNLAPGVYTATVATLQANVTAGDVTIASDGTGTLTLTGNGSQAAAVVDTLQLTLSQASVDIASTTTAFELKIVTAPTVTSAATSANGQSIILTFSKDINDTTLGAATAFTANNGTAITVNTVTPTASNVLTLALNTAIQYGQTVTVSYTPGTIVDFEDGVLAAIVDRPVTNNVPLPTVTVGAQSGTIVEGAGGTAIFPITTDNLAAGSYNVSVGGIPANVNATSPITITSSGATGGTGTLTLTGTAGVVEASPSLTLTLTSPTTSATATSAAFILEIDAPAIITNFTTTISIPAVTGAGATQSPITGTLANPAAVSAGTPVNLPDATATTLGFEFSTWAVTGTSGVTLTNPASPDNASFTMGTANVTVEARYTLTAWTFNPGTLANPTVGVAYTGQTVATATGGSGAWTYASEGATGIGNAVPGLTVAADGSITGTPTAAFNQAARTFTVTATDTNTGAVRTATFSITVNRGSQTAPGAPTLASANGSSITLNTIAGAEYSRDGGAWQASPTFTGLNLATSYTFTARMAQTADLAASAASTGASFSTTKGSQAAPSLTSITYNISGVWNQPGGVTVEITSPSTSVALFSLNNPPTPADTNPAITFAQGTSSGTIFVSFAETATLNASPATAISFNFLPKAATPTATPNGGEVSEGQLVTLTSTTSGATIRYTVDGSVPTASSTVYTVPFAITPPVTVRAIAIMTDMQNSDVMTVAFTPQADGNLPGNDGDVEIPFTQDGDTITLLLDTDTVDELIATAADDIVNIDVSALAGTTSVTMDSDVLQQLSDANVGITITLPQGTITFDAAATALLSDQATGNVTHTLFQPPLETLSQAQQTEHRPGDIVFRITTTDENGYITDFAGGRLTVTVPYDGPVPVTVWFLAPNGSRVRVPSSYASGYVTFTTDHLSEYLLRSDSQSGGSDSGSDSDKDSGSGSKPPQTGDYSNAILWWSVLFASMLGMVLTTILRKRRINKIKWNQFIRDISYPD